MSLISVRALVPFQQGQNGTDVIINNVHFNRTALNHFNYTLYSNGTLSNGSNCFLAFSVFRPQMSLNGTFVNGTSCYSPIKDLGQHGRLGISFAAMFAASIMFTLVSLRKHGKRFLPLERAWRAVGRRWQWYWLLAVAVCGTISCFMGVDVGRDYLQSTALVLQSLFYYIMTPCVIAAVWEGVRHWGKWQERQILAQNAVAFSSETTRESQEFWLPVVFYLFAWLNFFLAVPRTWTPIELQRSREQQEARAKPLATDGRFKAAGFMALVAVLVICYSLGHSIYRYSPRPASRLRQRIFYLQAAPVKFIIAIVLLGVKVGYTMAAAFSWSISPFKYDSNSGWIFGLGYTPVLLLIILFNICAHIEQNEDQYLISQREEQNGALDAELGLRNKKPNWWRRMRLDHRPPILDENGRLKAFVTEIGGGQPTDKNLEPYVEMGSMRTHSGDEGYKDNAVDHGVEVSSSNTLRSGELSCPSADIASSQAGLRDSYPSPDRHGGNSESYAATSSANSATSDAAPQEARSMLNL
ncbi:hypothetical protein VTN02DRAFT_5082 [Thermoascus thermophilus]